MRENVKNVAAFLLKLESTRWPYALPCLVLMLGIWLEGKFLQKKNHKLQFVVLSVIMS